GGRPHGPALGKLDRAHPRGGDTGGALHRRAPPRVRAERPARRAGARGRAARLECAPPAPVSAAPLVFLDANVLISAALGGPALEVLLELAHRRTIRPATSHASVVAPAT